MEMGGRERFLLIGGTGSLGRALVANLSAKRKYNDIEVTVLSRDEIKQKELKALYPWVNFVIGDVTDKESLVDAVSKADHVLNLAAMKHIEVCEEYPHRAHLVNFVGARNVAEVCRDVGTVSSVSLSSTDKAVLPINTYGLTKALAEKFYLHLAGQNNGQRWLVFRWGNVLGSRGSVIHAFARSLRNERAVYISDLAMTRFWIDIDEVADFMMNRVVYGSNTTVCIPEMRGAKVIALARATARVLGMDKYETRIAGIRPGEKIHEAIYLLEPHLAESMVTSSTCTQIDDAELEAMARKALGL